MWAGDHICLSKYRQPQTRTVCISVCVWNNRKCVIKQELRTAVCLEQLLTSCIMSDIFANDCREVTVSTEQLLIAHAGWKKPSILCGVESVHRLKGSHGSYWSPVVIYEHTEPLREVVHLTVLWRHKQWIFLWLLAREKVEVNVKHI